MPDPIPAPAAKADVPMRPIYAGCMIVLFGVLLFGGLIGYSIWQGISQSKVIDTFTQAERVLQPVTALPDAQAAALEAEIARFTASLDAGREDALALGPDRLNHLVARQPSLADLRGQFAVRSIGKDGIVVSICYQINALPFEKRSRFLVGEVTLRPELAERRPVLRVTGLRVPGREIPKWFLDQFALHHLLEKYLAEPGAKKRAAQLSAFQAEDGRLVLKSLPWVAK